MGEPINLSEVKLTSEDKQWLANQINMYGQKSSALANRFSLKRNTLRKYARTLNKKVITRASCGRPPTFSIKSITNIADKLTDQKYQMRSSNYENFLQSEARNSLDERNLNANNKVPKVSKKTIYRLEKKLDIKTKNGETTTNARAVAVSDIRNAVSFAAMNFSMNKIAKQPLILNADATLYTVGYDNKKKLQVKFIQTKKHQLSPIKIKQEKNDSGITNYTIKYFCLMSAIGKIANPVFIIQDEKMAENIIDTYSVDGLGISTGSASKGYIVFCNSRSCNLEFYKWFNETVLVEFINDLKISSGGGSNDDNITWFQLDGEMKQIEIYRDPSILQLLLENNIIVGKLPASTTEITQPCDRGNIFKASKTRNKNIGDDDVKKDVHMIDKLNEIFKNHIENHNGSSKNSKMTAAHVKMATLGLLRIQLALEETARPTIIKNSFKDTGVFDVSLGGCNIETILNNCSTDIDEPLRVKIINQMNELAKRITTNGELLETDFDDLDIESNIECQSKKKCKNELVLSRRRSVILTNIELLKSEEGKRNLKLSQITEAQNKSKKRKEKSEEKKELKKNKKIKIN